MKILFAIQGTGNGHLSRAKDVYPELKKHGDVDVLISGIQSDVVFPYPVKYKLYGLSFIFGRHGGVSVLETLKKLKLFLLIKDIKKLPVHEYDLVINDFEPVSSWACKLKKMNCISLSHQCAVLHENTPRPAKSDWFGEWVIQYYAPATFYYGFHFRTYAKNIFTPVIRHEIRDIKPENKGHYTVYLPSYDDETLVQHFSYFKDVQWEVFSKHNKIPFRFKNVSVFPVENNAFIKSMASCAGVLCGAGFEGPAEALYLEKKLLVIPMQNQYEQQCNAVALENMGITVIKSLSKKYYTAIRWWLVHTDSIHVHYPDQTAEIISKIICDIKVENFCKKSKKKNCYRPLNFGVRFSRKA